MKHNKLVIVGSGGHASVVSRLFNDCSSLTITIILDENSGAGFMFDDLHH
jgi:hypothetical protein